jgi:hypothetical protein
MAAKSIITVDVDDSQFREFHALFQKYTKQLESMPEGWQKVVGAIDDANDPMDHFSKSSKQSKDFLKIAAIQADAISKAMQKSTGVQDKFNGKLKDGSIQMERMAKHSQGMHKDLLKMSGLSTKMTAFGVGGMAVGATIAAVTAAIKAVYGATTTVASQNLDAKSLGLNIGQTQAFDANFKKYGIDSSALGNVQSMIGNPATWGTLAMSGVDPTTAQNQPVDQVAFNILKSESDKVRAWKESGQNAAFLFGQNYANSPFNFQQVSAAASYGRGDLASSWAKEQTDAKNNFISQDKGDAAAAAAAQLQADHDKVMNSFNSALVNATPALTTLANAISGLAFWSTGGSDAKSPSKGVSPSDIGNDHVASGSVTGGSSGNQSQITGEPPYFAEIEKRDGLPRGSLFALAMTEGHGRITPNAWNKASGAKGAFQFIPDTAKIYGLKDPMDLRQSAEAAALYLSDLRSRYHGDNDKALGAWNWGMGNKNNKRLDADIAANGNQWTSHLPNETSDFIKSFNKYLQTANNKPVNLNVTNSTSANVATSANAAGH